MNVKITYTGGASFRGETESGHAVVMDGAAEFGGENVQIVYSGGWDRYKRLKQFTDSFANENELRLVARTRLIMEFPDGLELPGNQFNTLVEVFSTLGFGHMIVEAQPYD